MKMLTVAVDEKFAKEIDSVIKSSGIYTSRSEFLKDAIRKNITETMKLNKNLEKIRKESEKLSLKVKKRQN